MKLYAAYGANLNKRVMRMRCSSSARPVGKFILTNAKLVFRGVADVEYCPGSEVPCGLWMIDESDEHALDRREGVNHSYPSRGVYYKEEGIVIRYKGKPRNVLIYLMTSEGVYPPSHDYAETIRKGYKDFGLDERYLDEAIKHAFLQKAPDDQTRSRRDRQRATHAQRKLVEMPEAVMRRRLDIKAAEPTSPAPKQEAPSTVVPSPKRRWTASTIVKPATPPTTTSTNIRAIDEAVLGKFTQY